MLYKDYIIQKKRFQNAIKEHLLDFVSYVSTNYLVHSSKSSREKLRSTFLHVVGFMFDIFPLKIWNLHHLSSISQ